MARANLLRDVSEQAVSAGEESSQEDMCSMRVVSPMYAECHIPFRLPIDRKTLAVFPFPIDGETLAVFPIDGETLAVLPIDLETMAVLPIDIETMAVLPIVTDEGVLSRSSQELFRSVCTTKKLSHRTGPIETLASCSH